MELLHRGDLVWTSLTSLPTVTHSPSATLIGQCIYVMADREYGYVCSLTHVLTSKTQAHLLSWEFLPPFNGMSYKNTPSICSLQEQLIVVDETGRILQFLKGKWAVRGRLSGNDRTYCLIATPSPNKMLAVGGVFPLSDWDNVDLCTAV